MDQISLKALTQREGQYLDALSDISGFRFVRDDLPQVPEPWHPAYLTGQGPWRLSLAIVLTDQVLGEVILTSQPGSWRTCSLALAIARREERNRGFGSKALKLALTHAFYSLGMLRVTADTADNNPQARRALEKAGFRLRGSEPLPGEPWGLQRLHYAITLEEFSARETPDHNPQAILGD